MTRLRVRRLAARLDWVDVAPRVTQPVRRTRIRLGFFLECLRRRAGALGESHRVSECSFASPAGLGREPRTVTVAGVEDVCPLGQCAVELPCGVVTQPNRHLTRRPRVDFPTGDVPPPPDAGRGQDDDSSPPKRSGRPPRGVSAAFVSDRSDQGVSAWTEAGSIGPVLRRRRTSTPTPLGQKAAARVEFLHATPVFDVESRLGHPG